MTERGNHMKRVAVLGSTGSIGTQALDILGQYPAEFQIAALAANENVDRLAKQALRFLPAKIGIVNPAGRRKSCGSAFRPKRKFYRAGRH